MLVSQRVVALNPDAVRIARRVVKESIHEDTDDPFVIVALELSRLAAMLESDPP